MRLLQLHWIPRQVEIYDHVAELKVQTFATRIGRNKDLRIAREPALDVPALIEVHGAIQANDTEATAFEILRQHCLSRNEFREDQDFEAGVVLIPL